MNYESKSKGGDNDDRGAGEQGSILTLDFFTLRYTSQEIAAPSAPNGKE